MFGGPGTIFTGTSNQPAPTFNIAESFGLSGPSAAMANMAVQSIIPSFFGNKGDVFGQFSPKLGFGEQLRRQNAYAMQQEVTASASKLDEAFYQKMFEGIANLHGTPFGEREKKGAATMSKDMASFMSLAAQTAPDFVDEMHGTRGSVAVMANRMASASRYLQDPTKGTMGLSKESLNNLVSTFNDKMFGPNADISQMRGISAGQAGAMFDQMTRRGLLGSSRPKLEEVAKDQGMTVDELAKLPDFSAKVQQFQASRTADKLKAMTGAVAAMKDIFGENGQADAPMSQIFNALQQVTQNSLNTMNPAEIEKTVRNLNNASKMAGVDLQGMQQVSAMAGQATDRMGVNRAFAPGVATRAMTAAAAFGSQNGNSNVFGLFDKERMIQVAANMEAANVSSQESNEAAALLRMSDQGLIKQGVTPELDKYIEQLRSKEGPVDLMPREALDAALAKQGVSARKFSAYAAQTTENEAIIHESNLSRAGAAAQRQQNKAMYGAGLRQGLVDAEVLASNEQESEAHGRFIANVTEAISEFSPTQNENFDKRQFGFFVPKVKEMFKKETGKELTDEQAKQFLDFGKGQASSMYNRFGYGNEAMGRRLMSKDFLESKETMQQQVEATSMADIALEKFGRGSPTRRFVDALSSAKPGETVGDFVRKVFPVATPAQIDEAVKNGLQVSKDQVTEINSRDLLKDTATLMTTAGANNLSQEQKDNIDSIKRVYGITDEDVKGMKGKKQSEISSQLSKSGNVVKAAALEKLHSIFQASGISKLEDLPQPPPTPTTPAAGTTPAPAGTTATGTTPAPGTPAPPAAPTTPTAAATNLFNDVIKTVTSAVPGLTGPAGQATAGQAAGAAKSFLAPVGDMLKTFDLGKMSSEAIKQYSTGGSLLNVFAKAEKKKQEESEKATAKVQTVRLEGGTELTGRLNIVSEEIMMKIPQTQKI